MKMMKKMFSMVVIICVAFFMYACGEGEKIAELEKKIEQLSTEKAALEKKAADTADKPAAAQTYKIGFSGAITGTTSDVGVPYSKAIEDYCKFVNDEKLLGDDNLVCFIKDDNYKTENTKRNFEAFLDEGIVLYLNYATGSTLALGKDFDEEKIPTISASYHAGNLDKSNYVFLPIVSYSSQAIALGEYVAKHHKGGGTPKVAMFLHPSAFGRGPVDDLKKAIAAGLNLEIVELVEHGKDLDNTAMLKRWQNKNVQYVISQTVQPPVATMLKSAQSLGVIAGSYGEAGKFTFLGLHYAGGPDLVALAGSAAEGFFWTTSYKLMNEPGPGTEAQLALAKRYGRDESTAYSQNYTNGLQVAQIAVETIIRAKAKGKKIDRQTLYEELLGMNGYKAFYSLTTVGPITYSKTDRQGVDMLQLYLCQDGVFRSVGMPFAFTPPSS